MTRRLIGAGLIGLALALSACGSASDQKGGQPKQAPEVGYIVVQRTSVPIVTELSGRTSPFEVSEVRPQVSA